MKVQLKKVIAAMLLGMLSLSGCGDDSSGEDMATADTTDMTSDPACGTGSNAPNPGERMGSCCYRASNADHLDQPDLRLNWLNIDAPAALSNNAIVQGLLQDAMESERFNWLIEVQYTSETAATIRTGFGRRAADGSFAFANGDAPPEGGSPDRFNPITLEATADGESLSTDQLADPFTVPVLDMEGVNIELKLPLRGLTIHNATLSEDRSCVGARVGRLYSTDGGHITTYVQMEDAANSTITLLEGKTVCELLGSLPTTGEDCTTHPFDETTDEGNPFWRSLPDSICNEDGCSDACTAGEDCNAWLVEAGFAAHGVVITE